MPVPSALPSRSGSPVAGRSDCCSQATTPASSSGAETRVAGSRRNAPEARVSRAGRGTIATGAVSGVVAPGRAGVEVVEGACVTGQPFTAPADMPVTRLRWMIMKKTTTGSENSTEAAICPPKSVPLVGVLNEANQTGSVYIDWSFMNV